MAGRQLTEGVRERVQRRVGGTCLAGRGGLGCAAGWCPAAPRLWALPDAFTAPSRGRQRLLQRISPSGRRVNSPLGAQLRAEESARYPGVAAGAIPTAFAGKGRAVSRVGLQEGLEPDFREQGASACQRHCCRVEIKNFGVAESARMIAESSSTRCESEHTLESFVFQAEQSELSQSVLMEEVLQHCHHLHGPPLDSLQEFYVPPVLRALRLDTILQFLLKTVTRHMVQSYDAETETSSCARVYNLHFLLPIAQV